MYMKVRIRRSYIAQVIANFGPHWNNAESIRRIEAQIAGSVKKMFFFKKPSLCFYSSHETPWP